MTAYSEFRIRIERGPRKRTYRTYASGDEGEVSGVFRMPFSDTDLENFVLKVGRTRRGVRKLASPEWELAKVFGGHLFKAVMKERVGELYRSAFNAAETQGRGLRLALSLTDVPELGEIPWEYLYDPPNFLSLSSSTPVVRYLDLPKPRGALEIQLPLRILAVISAPSDADPLNTPLERSNLDEALRPLVEANAVTVDWLEGATLLALTKKLQPDTYHILHFIGHGGFDNTSGEGALLFEDELGRGRIVSGEQLATVLHDKDSLRLVFLNSCEGARNSVKDPFSGVAASLVQREIPAVIGMQFEITDRAAVLFASEFYSMLAEGKPVDAAITEARLAIFADHNDVEWGTPVLFMRVADGRLFDLADAATALPRVDTEALPAKTVAAVEEAQPLPVPSRLPWRRIAVGVAVLVGALLLILPGPTGSIRVNPGGAFDTGLVTVTGSDFQPGEKVDIYIDGIPVTTVVVEADGSIARFELDVGGRTSAEVSALGRLSGKQANATYSFIPGVSTTPGLTDSAGPTATDSGDATADSPGILFYSDTDQETGETDNELYLLDPVTRDVTQLTNNSEEDTFPTWSPDHTKIAYSLNGDIYVVDFPNGRLNGDGTGMTSGSVRDSFPTWSKTGWIAFVRTDNDGSAILRIRDDQPGDTPVPITTGRSDRAPAWSPDGETLAFMAANDKDVSTIYTIRADGTGRAAIVNEGFSDLNPNWSPDSKTIVFVRRPAGGNSATSEIHTVDLATRTVSDPLTDNKVQDGNPVWSPDGAQIAFYRALDASGRPDFHLWVIDADGSHPHDLMTGRKGRNLDPIWR